VLVVDDDESICEALKSSLEIFGYDVVTAHNGAEALETLKHSTRPSVIILDMMMPVMDGEAFLRARRDEPLFQAIPVVVMTAFPHVKAEGANTLLKKPVALETLLRVLSEICPTGTQADTLESPNESPS
jgi:CheY-like chemotaxis protein